MEDNNLHPNIGIPQEITNNAQHGVIKNSMKPLPISEQEFVDVVGNGQLYIDKTKLIYDLLNYKSKYVFLFRPRRFGKSLLLSTIEAILLGRKELFTNLQIGNLGPEYSFESSHVVRFSMGSFGNNPDLFEKKLTSSLKFLARNNYGLRLTSVGTGDTILQLIHSLYNSHDSIPLGKKPPLSNRTADVPKVAVLIDECDFQLLPNIHDPKKLQTTINFLSEFYSGLKAVSGMIRYLVVVGITKFKAFYQSSSNFIDDISLKPDFSSICGFTKDEIRSSFWKHIEYSLEKRKDLKISDSTMTDEELFASIVDWYDGYTWDGVTEVFNPVSLMTFLTEFRFKQYWYDTGDSSIIKEFLKTDADYFNMFSNKNTIESDESPGMLTEISPYAVLFQAGYLTIKEISSSKSRAIGDNDILTYHLAIPNREVRESLAKQILMSRFFGLRNDEVPKQLYDRFSEFCNFFASRKERDCQNTLVSIFASYSHQLHSQAESYYKTLLLTALCFSKGEVTAEASVGGGDIDLFLELPTDIMIIEVKYNHFPTSSSGNKGVENQEVSSANTMPGDAESGLSGKTLGRKAKADPKKDVLRLLDKGISDAFRQIDTKGYAKKFLYPKQKKNIWLVAVSVVGRDNAKIKFKRAKALP
ncbi:MAG: AAA family ATPase [Deltaproteobacteria bacterium]|jgi:hypothetical protein|nr:AAA family ATPase [Deltaproteobacteria bacterium]